MTEQTFVQIDYVNEFGRDLIVPDLHGSRTALFQKLDRANFDPSCDRVWCLGDLVDRGPESFETLQLLKEPWFKAIRGNHEDLMLSFEERLDSIYYNPEAFIMNGGGWIFKLSGEQLHEYQTELLPLVQNLPYIRTLLDPDDQVLFHMVHAELMLAVKPEDDDVVEGDDSDFFTDQAILSLARGDLDVLAQSDENGIKRFMATSSWGRRTVRQLKQDLKLQEQGGLNHSPAQEFPIASGSKEMLHVSQSPYAIGLSPTFVGHTIVKNIGMHRSHIFMDRCGYLTGRNEEFGLIVVDAQEALSWLQVNVPRDESTLLDSHVPFADSKLQLPPVPQMR